MACRAGLRADPERGWQYDRLGLVSLRGHHAPDGYRQRRGQRHHRCKDARPVHPVEFHFAGVRGGDRRQHLLHAAGRSDCRAGRIVPCRVAQIERPGRSGQIHKSIYDRLGLGVQRKVYNRRHNDRLMDVVGMDLSSWRVLDTTGNRELIL